MRNMSPKMMQGCYTKYYTKLLIVWPIVCKDSKQYNGPKGFVYLKVVMPSVLQSEALLAPQSKKVFKISSQCFWVVLDRDYHTTPFTKLQSGLP